jgi:hypothetical protein
VQINIAQVDFNQFPSHLLKEEILFDAFAPIVTKIAIKGGFII